MDRFSEFVLAIASDAQSASSLAVSLLAMVLGFTGLGGSIPTWSLWLIGYGALFLTAWRMWRKEYRDDAPSVELEFDHRGARDDRISVLNTGPGTAFNVKVRDIVRGDMGYISFEPTKVNEKERTVLDGMVHRSSVQSPIFSGRLLDFLMRTQPSTRSDEYIKGFGVPLYVEFLTANRHRYESHFNIFIKPWQDEVRVDYVERRRIFEPIRPIRWVGALLARITLKLKHFT